MNMKKILMLAASAALVSSFTGCFGSDSDDAGAGISGLAVTSGDTAVVSGSITLADSTQYPVVLVNSDTIDFLDCETNPDEGSLSMDIGASNCIVPSMYLDSGANTLKIAIVSAEGSEVASAEASFTFNGTGSTGFSDVPLVAEDLVVLGAQGASEGSSIDLDSWTVYTSGQLTGSVPATIDLVLHNHASGLVLMTPTDAIAAGFLANSLVARDVESMIFPVTLTSAAFDDIDSLAQIPDFENVDPLTTAPVAEGDAFIVTTDMFGTENNAGLYLIRVDAATTGNAGTISVKGLHP